MGELFNEILPERLGGENQEQILPDRGPLDLLCQYLQSSGPDTGGN